MVGGVGKKWRKSRERHEIQNKGPAAEVWEGRCYQRLGHTARDVLSFCRGYFVWDIAKGDVAQAQPWLETLHKEQPCHLTLDLAVVIRQQKGCP